MVDGVWSFVGNEILNWNTAAVLTCTFLLWVVWDYFYDDHRKLPPGPRGVPLLGYLPFLGEEHVTYRDLSETYGPIISVKLGPKRVVVLNNLEVIKEGLNKRDVLHRPAYFFLARLNIHGIISLNGDAWTDNRRFCLQVLRDLGFGKSSMEERIREECKYLTDVIASHGGNPIDVGAYLAPSVSNNIASLVMGRRFDFDHPRRRFMDRCLNIILHNAAFFSAVDFFYLLGAALRAVSYFAAGKVSRTVEELKDYFRREIKENKETMKENEDRHFIDGYLKKIAQSGQVTNYNNQYLLGNMINFFGAGTNTVRTTILWHLLNCARCPREVQEKIQKEIQDVVGNERLPCWEDRLKMPFTMAVIWEMYRWRTIAPLSVVRGTAADTEIAGYTIPAGTPILANLWAVHTNPLVWDNPEEFNPYRHLSDDGSKLLPRHEHIIPFSTGKRMCPGETFATVEVFLYLTTLLQKFTVMPADGNEISMVPCMRLVAVPAVKQALRFLPR
ncbi:cytochrome P450 2J6-like [Ornithodoros turicata]|uniref:cytochrome P450 2J6-like n=1 Tax=Ornithodoros turicata TaxID=34597 RepID=UPI003139DA66